MGSFATAISRKGSRKREINFFTQVDNFLIVILNIVMSVYTRKLEIIVIMIKYKDWIMGEKKDWISIENMKVLVRTAMSFQEVDGSQAMFI